jgi:hypothetical protein
MSNAGYFTDQENIILDALRSAANILGAKTEYREFHRRMLNARRWLQRVKQGRQPKSVTSSKPSFASFPDFTDC